MSGYQGKNKKAYKRGRTSRKEDREEKNKECKEEGDSGVSSKKILLYDDIPKAAEALEKLEKSETFKNWRRESPEYFLSSIFTIIEGKTVEWEIGYYNGREDRMTSFIVNEKIEISSLKTEVFKEPDKKIKELDKRNIRTEIDEVLKITDRFQKENFPSEKPVKIIVVLHQEENAIWNITFLTQNFKILRIKIDAESGKVKEHTLNSLFSMIEDVK